MHNNMNKPLIILFFLCLLSPLSAQQIEADSVVARCPIDTIDGRLMYRYTVDKSVGLYRVSKIFGVSQDIIIETNPDLRTRGLRYGEVIHIPAIGVELPLPPAQPKAEETHTATTAVPKDTSLLLLDSVGTDSLALADTMLLVEEDVQDYTRIALLLPFQVHNTKRDQTMDRFMEFYEGCLLATYDLQAAGKHIALDVRDTEKGTALVRQWVDSNTLADSHAIIGLAYPLQLLQVAPWAKEHQVPVLAPFCGQTEDIETNPYLYFFNSSAEQEAKRMGEWLETHKDSINCVLIEAKDADIPASIRLIRQEITARGISHTTTSIRQILNDSIQDALRDSVENILIFNTEKYGNVQMLVPRIIQGKGTHQVSLLGQYSWTRETIALPMVYTSLFATRDSVDTSEYELLYERYFGHEHTSETPRYDLLGYDLMRTIYAILSDTTYTGLQSDIRFEQHNPDGGYINTNIHVVHTGR